MISNYARKVVENFMLSIGLLPDEGWDENDPRCNYDAGDFQIVTVQARIPEDMEVDIDILDENFCCFLENQNRTPGIIQKLWYYRFLMYFCPCCCGERYIHASVYFPKAH